MKKAGSYRITDDQDIVLLAIDGDSDSVETKMREGGFIPAGSDELDGFNKRYPDIFLDCLIVALGEKGKGDGGLCVVPCLDVCSPSSSLRLMYGEPRKRSWPTWTLFAAIQNGKH